MLRYEDTVTLDLETTLGTIDSIEQEVTGVGLLLVSPRNKVRFQVEADNLWELRGLLDDFAATLAAYGVDFMPDSTKITGEAVSTVGQLNDA